MTIERDDSRVRCPGCSNGQCFAHAHELGINLIIDYVFRCDVCGSRIRVKGTCHSMSATRIKRRSLLDWLRSHRYLPRRHGV